MTSGFNSPIDCNGAAYGKDLNVKSCVEAQKLIPTTDSPLKFGQRFRQGVDVPTPWRWVSTDGKCVIEVPETKLQSAPQGSYLDLSTAADDMVELCLEYKDHPEGSHASNIGSSGGLSLKMMSYRPVVSCRGYLSFTGGKNMEEIMKKMSAENVKRNFGRRGLPGVRVVLPITFTSTNQLYSSQLVATVDLTTTNQDAATWYDIWAATAALDAICVRKGMAGSASWLGE
ncbi:MAG: hypothetical protein Q9194_004938 [Teloschistes cf. exilis]